jgi:hypothetical protein
VRRRARLKHHNTAPQGLARRRPFATRRRGEGRGCSEGDEGETRRGGVKLGHAAIKHSMCLEAQLSGKGL